MTKKNSKATKKKEQEIIDVFKDPANKNEEGEKEMENNIVVEKIVNEEELKSFKKELSDMLNGVFVPYIDNSKITQKKIDNLVDKITNTVKDELLVNPVKTLLFCIKLITNLQKEISIKNDTLTIEQIHEVIKETHTKLVKDIVSQLPFTEFVLNNEEPKEVLEEEDKIEFKEEEPKIEEIKEFPEGEKKEVLKGYAYFLAQQKK